MSTFCERCGRHPIECGHEPEEPTAEMPTGFHSLPHDLGRGYSVEFTWRLNRFDVFWSPEMPVGKRARQLMPAYQRARHSFLTALSEKLGITIAVVDGSVDPTGGAHG